LFHILIDTCVWLDLGKDPDQRPLLGALEELLKHKRISLIVPRTVIDEFARNKDRVIKDSSRSLSSTVKRVKDMVNKFGDPKQKKVVLQYLNDLDHKLPSLGETAIDAFERVEAIFAKSVAIETIDAVKLRAAQRAIDKKAPFHEGKNSMNDAVIIETYADFIAANRGPGNRFAFITHNVKDFSQSGASNKLPHVDLAAGFLK
jgi:hypothetical protein